MTGSGPGHGDGERLSKRVAALRACSRREAEQYIEGGWVRVDGRVVEEPQFRVTGQSIAIDAGASLMALADVTLVLNKPPDITDPQKCLTRETHLPVDPSGQRPLQRHFRKLVCPVPLEAGASGLLVFTQDWRVERKLTEDAGVMEHEVMVEVNGEVTDDHLRRLNHSTGSRGQSLPACKVSLNSTSQGTPKLRFAVKGSHPGLIAWLCDRAGLQILGMKRIRLGRVGLGGVTIGQWRYLAPHERF